MKHIYADDPSFSFDVNLVAIPFTTESTDDTDANPVVLYSMADSREKFDA